MTTHQHKTITQYQVFFISPVQGTEESTSTWGVWSPGSRTLAGIPRPPLANTLRYEVPSYRAIAQTYGLHMAQQHLSDMDFVRRVPHFDRECPQANHHGVLTSSTRVYVPQRMDQQSMVHQRQGSNAPDELLFESPGATRHNRLSVWI
jgi:hypothetical protein